jgi:hypothetical protein
MGQETVLIVEDNADIRNTLQQLLGREGVPVLPKPFDIEKLLGEVSSAFARTRREQP